jgi:hypothetical protein
MENEIKTSKNTERISFKHMANPKPASHIRNYVTEQKEIDTTQSTKITFVVVRVPVYRSRGPGSIHGATTFSQK